MLDVLVQSRRNKTAGRGSLSTQEHRLGPPQSAALLTMSRANRERRGKPAPNMPKGLRLSRFRIDPARGGARIGRLPFLRRGPVEVTLKSPLTFLIGENGSGKTTHPDEPSRQ